MGTRGYIVVKYKSMYYVIFNKYDSYPENLGRYVVAFIKENIQMLLLLKSTYSINSMKEMFAKLFEFQFPETSRDLAIKREEKYRIRHPEFYNEDFSKQQIEEAIDEREFWKKKMNDALDLWANGAYVMQEEQDEIFMIMNTKPGEYSTFIEWIYTIDIDDNAFIADVFKFHLYNIPAAWLDFFKKEDSTEEAENERELLLTRYSQGWKINRCISKYLFKVKCQSYLKHYYRPNGIGYEQAFEHFKSLQAEVALRNN